MDGGGHGMRRLAMIPQGASSFWFSQADLPWPPIEVFTYRPASFGPQSPIIILLHGWDRAAAYFRDCWIDPTSRRDWLLIAPKFDVSSFPTADEYNLGNVSSSSVETEAVNSQDRWTFDLLDRLFEEVKTHTRSERASFYLFGHSAGAQFAHRYLALARRPRASHVIAGAPAFYMLPDASISYPDGFAGTGREEERIGRFLSAALTVLVGDRDTDEDEDGTPWPPNVMAQGPNRLLRGVIYYNLGRRLAARMGLSFGWSLCVAPSVGHFDDQIAAPAISLIGQLEAQHHHT